MILSYDTAKMQELLKNFYLLTKIRIVVFNDTFQKIAEYPTRDSSFCSLIRSDPSAMQRCATSDRYACEQSRRAGNIYSYICHAGLTETVAPLRYGNMVIGYLMFGQVLQCDDKADYWQVVRSRCQGYVVDTIELERCYSRKKPVEMEQVVAAAQILEACAGYLWLQRTISLQEDTLPNQIDEYITGNLSADLSVNALCQRFGISRSKLYKIAGEYYGKGIEQLTRELRVSKATELLRETDLPVSAVASQVGYPDYNYFIKVFKRETGITPKQYSLRHRKA